MNFVFTNEYPLSRIDEIVQYLLGPRLWIPQQDYPDFLDWAQKVYAELKKDLKRAMIALDHNEIAGAIIYQRHKHYPEALEIKNLTVRPDKRGRYIASFLLRNAEIEGAKEFGSQHVLCDAKAKNLAIRFFLERHRYQIIDSQDLYGINSGTDFIYKKHVSGLSRKIR